MLIICRKYDDDLNIIVIDIDLLKMYNVVRKVWVFETALFMFIILNIYRYIKLKYSETTHLIFDLYESRFWKTIPKKRTVLVGKKRDGCHQQYLSYSYGQRLIITHYHLLQRSEIVEILQGNLTEFVKCMQVYVYYKIYIIMHLLCYLQKQWPQIYRINSLTYYPLGRWYRYSGLTWLYNILIS